MDEEKILPTWAPRVPQGLIRRLYQTDAQGIRDEELIDEVGYGLLLRCEGFIAANEARQGRLACPRCAGEVRHRGRSEEVMRCAGCGWTLTWGEYFATIQHQQLSGAEPVLRLFRDFVARFPTARTAPEKMLLIDGLIHGFHWYSKTNSPTRPVGVNLLEGRLNEVIAFLDGLAYSENSTAGTRENYAKWNRNSQNARRWSRRGE